ncbi:MAG: DUF6265 family protein [Novosphingobium sp.]|nr:DUF6265 family protein [Novosphingobium sp.]
MRSWLLAVAAGSLAALGALPARAEQGSLPEWLAGCWEQRDGERWVEECWMAPRGDIMLGAGRSGRGNALTGWEAMQIGRGDDGMLTFWASPKGAPRVATSYRAER